MDIYENIKRACAEHDTAISTVLRELGRSSGNTGSWRNGQLPRIDIVMEIADYLHISIDELIRGPEEAAKIHRVLTADERDWLDIISRIPDDKREMCKDFLRTHGVEPDKFEGKMSV